MDRHPLAHGLKAAHGQKSVLDLLAEKTGVETRIHVAPDTGGPILRPLSGDARAAAGKYQLQGEIARGGVGTVLKGYDTHLGRDVALKLLHEEHLGNPEMLQRFVEEAQIGGQLQHPGVVPVYDLALQGERPFFSMKLIKGRTLSALLDEREELAHELRRFLAIFEQICLTMAYAHARGVIHRDLKPSNVMVGAFGEVQVVDWGMGKVLGRDERRAPVWAALSVIATVRSETGSSPSVVGSVMGTPAYMPPEQARGDVEGMDEQSDVFSLGAVLCQVLTGKPPYVGAGALQMAAAAELGPCQDRLDACGADPELVRLVRECLSPAPPGRPADAGAVATRIGAHLAAVEERTRRGQVEAAEQRAAAQTARRVQRLTVGLAASVLVLLALGGGGWWWIASKHRERTDLAGRVVEAALADARVGLGRARAATGMEPWHAALGAARQAHALATSNDVAPQVRADAAAALDEVTREHAAAGARADRLAEEQRTLATLEAIPIPPEWDYNPFSKEESRRRDDAYRLALGDPEALAVGDVRQPERWAAALDDWAFADWVLAGTKRARLLAIANALDPDPRRAELRDLILTNRIRGLDLRRLAEGDPDAPPMTALTLAALLAYRWDQRGAVEVLRAAHERHPDHYLVALRLADSAGMSRQWNEMLRFASIARALRPDSASAPFLEGQALWTLGRHTEAEAAQRRAIELEPRYAAAYHNLAHVLERQGRREESLAAMQDAARLNPDDEKIRTCLSAALHRVGRHGEGRDERMAAQQIRTRKLEEDLAAAREAVIREPASAAAHECVGDALGSLEREEAALAAYREASRIDPSNASYPYSIGFMLTRLNRGDEAVPHFEDAVRLDPAATRARWHLAEWHTAQGKHEEALAYLRDAVSASPRDTMSLQALGMQLERMNRLDDALATYLGALRIDPRLEYVRNSAADVLWRQGKREEAIEAHREAVRLQPWSSVAHAGLASRLTEAGRLDEAERACRAGLARVGPDVAILSWLGRIHFLENRHDDAMAAWRAILEIEPGHHIAHLNLFLALRRKGDEEAAERHLQEAIRHAPDALSLYQVAKTLFKLKRHEDAAATFGKTLELDPQMGEAWWDRGTALGRLGRRREALRHLEKALEVGTKYTTFPPDPANRVQELRSQAEAEPRLERILALEAEPRDGKEAGEAVLLGSLRREDGQVVALVRALRPREYDDQWRNLVHYNGACCAARASEDAALSAERRGELQHLALTWLRAELAANPDRARLEHWLKDRDLRTLRDVDPLPEGFASFWRAVRDALEAK
jgi:serine/threonine-protein kinase